MEEQKKYELTADEISMLIGIGASYVCEGVSAFEIIQFKYNKFWRN